MKKITFLMNGIAGEIYYEHDSTPLSNKPICIYLSGMPGSMGRNAGTHFFSRIGFAVIQPQYLGTYDSDGEFIPENTFETLRKINQIISEGKIIDIKKDSILTIENNISLVFGHSFGCYVALKTLHFLRSVNVMILFSPLIGFGRNYGSLADPIAQLEYLKKGRPYTYRIGSEYLWIEHFKKDLESNQRENRFDFDHNAKILVVIGAMDSSFDSKQILKIVETDGIKNHKKIVDCIIVPRGEHDIESLLTLPVQRYITNLVRQAGHQINLNKIEE